MNTEQVEAFNIHLQTVVFASEKAEINLSLGEQLAITTDVYGKLKFVVYKDDGSITESDLITKWNSHKDGCSDCDGWSV